MSDYSPAALLRLSMSLKNIRPVGNEAETVQSLRQAARILEGLACMPNPGRIVEEAVEHAALVKDVVSQKKTEAVIERRIREGLWKAALKLGRNGHHDSQTIEVAQARVCQDLLQARQLADSQSREKAYDQAEQSLHGLREALRKGATKNPGSANPQVREAAAAWIGCDPRDMAAFDGYMAAIAIATPTVAAPRRNRMQPA